MIKAINALSFPGGLDGSLDPFEAIRLAAEYRFEAVELCIADAGTPLGIDAGEKLCLELKAVAQNEGIKLPSVCSGLYWSRALGDADPAARAKAREDLEAMIRITSWLGADVLLTIPGAVDIFFSPSRSVQPYDEVWRNSTEGLAAVLPAAQEHGVRLGLENVWNRFLLSPMEIANYIDSFESPWIGAYVDVANVLPFGYPDQWLRILGRRVVGVHFKDFRKSVGTAAGFVDLLAGDVDWPAVVVALKEIGYEGVIAAEMIPHYKHHPLVRIENTSRAMDAILGR